MQKALLLLENFYANNKISFGASIGVSATLIQAVISLFVGALIARELGPEGRGFIGNLFLWIQALTWGLSFGIARGNTHYISEEKYSEQINPTLLSSGMLYAFLVGCFVALLLSAVNFDIKIHPTFIGLLLFTSLFGDIFINIVLANKNYVLFNSKKIIEIIFVFLFLYLSYMLDSINVFKVIIIIFISQNITLLIIFIIFYKKNKIKELWIFNFKKIIRSVRWGLKAYISDFPKMFYSLGPSLLITPLFGVESFGLYSAGLSLAGIPLIFFNSVASTVLVEYSGTKKIFNINLIKKAAFSKYFIFTILISISLYVFSPMLVTMIYGEKFKSAGVVARVLVVWMVISGFGVILQHWLFSQNKPKIAAICCMASALLTLFLILYIGTDYGILGIAYSCVFGSILEVIFFLIFLMRER